MNMPSAPDFELPEVHIPEDDSHGTQRCCIMLTIPDLPVDANVVSRKILLWLAQQAMTRCS